jgi:hypothetical protein
MNSTLRRGETGLIMASLLYVKGSGASKRKLVICAAA